MPGDEGSCDPESESRSTQFLGGEKGIEDVFVDFLGDSAAAIVNGDAVPGTSCATYGVEADRNIGSWGRGFNRVAQQVAENLGELAGEARDLSGGTPIQDDL